MRGMTAEENPPRPQEIGARIIGDEPSTRVVEIAAALIEASIGYHTARSALRHAQECLEGGETCWCERCLCCFGGDLQKAVSADLRYWERVSEERKQQVRLILQRTKDWDWAEATTLSMMYPTMTP